jgi:hypothetical protein
MQDASALPAATRVLGPQGNATVVVPNGIVWHTTNVTVHCISKQALADELQFAAPAHADGHVAAAKTVAIAGAS